MKSDVLLDVAGFLLLILAVVAALLIPAGCATSRPCASTMPTRAKLVSLAAPEKFAYIDPEADEARVGMRIAVDAESAARFFGYVESLEAAARKALGCLAR